jgi:hypothetical protein
LRLCYALRAQRGAARAGGGIAGFGGLVRFSGGNSTGEDENKGGNQDAHTQFSCRGVTACLALCSWGRRFAAFRPFMAA